MYLQTTSLIFILQCTYGLSVNTRTDTTHSKLSNSQDKRSLLIGDLSYSYSATDIGSKEGSHVKTITVIKNIGSPKYHKPRPHHPFDDWDADSKNRFNFVFKFPEIPQIDSGTFFRTETPKKVVPTKQPTDRQTPVFNTEFDISDFDDQPNVNGNTNIDNSGPQVFENNPEAPPDPLPTVNTENSVSIEASDEVEYIQTDGEKSKSAMPTPAMFHSKKVTPSRATSSNGYRISSDRGKTNEKKKLQSHRQSSEFVEDFSDYSMHNVKHLVDPMKVKDSLLKYTQNQANLDLKKLTNAESVDKGKTYDSYGNVVQKSQSLLDASQQLRNNSNVNAQASKRPYVAPSLKKGYNSPSQKPSPKVTTTTPSKGLVFFSTTQKPYVAPKKLKSTVNIDKSLFNPSTERIQQPMFPLQFNKDNNREQISEQMIKIEFQPEQPKENYKAPNKQLIEEKKPEQQFHSYSIRNPLTTSLPVQHNHHEQLKLPSYVAVPIDADLPKQHLLNNMPKRYVRHHIVFDSKPPHPFMESPFQPVKAILMG